MHYTLLLSSCSLLIITLGHFHLSSALSPVTTKKSKCTGSRFRCSSKSCSSRRSALEKLVSSSSVLITSSTAGTTVAPGLARGITQPQQGTIQGAGGSITRVEGLGGGFDLTTSSTTKGVDVIYPRSMEGRWRCRRVVTSVEGDAGQAELAWRNLGGVAGAGGKSNSMLNYIESFDTEFLIPSMSSSMAVKNEYLFENEVFRGAILDRGFEMESRTKSNNVIWNVDSPDMLSYERDGSTVEIAVVQRKVEMPSEKGFGFDELYRITSSAGGIFGENKVQRAVRVKRRYRRALDEESGGRIVEGLEIMKTYRVLDGIAGVEMPTSTTKSQIKLTR